MEEPRIRSDGLQLSEHRRFQERFWKLERVAWIAFAVVTVSALLGLTGAGGPLATASRVARWETADELQIALQPRVGAAERTVMLAPEFTKSFQLEDVQPQPSKSSVSDLGQILVFDNPGTQGGQITIHIRAQSVGRKPFTITIDGGTPNALTTYVFP